jgi:hypothetical protein
VHGEALHKGARLCRHAFLVSIIIFTEADFFNVDEYDVTTGNPFDVYYSQLQPRLAVGAPIDTKSHMDALPP